MSRKKSVRMTLFRLVASAAVMIAVFAGFVAPVAASSHSVAAGSFSFVLLSNTVRTAGPNLIITERAEAIYYSGPLIGTAIDNDTYIVRADGSLTGAGTEDCAVCTLGGQTGSYSAVFTFTENGGRLQFISGTGGLAGLHGGGTFTLDTYSYPYWFGP